MSSSADATAVYRLSSRRLDSACGGPSSFDRRGIRSQSQRSCTTLQAAVCLSMIVVVMSLVMSWSVAERRRYSDPRYRQRFVRFAVPTDSTLPQHPCGPTTQGLSAMDPIGSPIDSVVALRFDVTDDELTQARGDARMAASLALMKAVQAPMDDPASLYFTFATERRATAYTTRLSSVAADVAAAASRCRATGDDGLVQPLQFDAVYTYVNGNSSSHAAGRMLRRRQGLTVGMEDARFRDWGELQYSMRALHSRTKDLLGRDALRATLRRVHIVVADVDQMPSFLNRSHPAVSIVTHAQLFTSNDEFKDALPTFNSNAIEAVLHRVPGLARWFWYLNNDMLLGRTVSLFDYFRPLSNVRQEFRMAGTTATGGGTPQQEGLRGMHAAARCLVDGAEAHDAVTTAVLLGGYGSGAPLRVTVLLEPILYFERRDLLADRELVPKALAITNVAPDGGRRRSVEVPPSQLTATHAVVTTPTTTTSLRLSTAVLARNGTTEWCSTLPHRPSAWVDMQMKEPMQLNRHHQFVNRQREMLFQSYGLPPAHSFAHYPRLVDLDVLTRVQEVDFRAWNAKTLRNFQRSPSDEWTPYVADYGALAQRRTLDGALMQRLGLWRRPTREEMRAAVATPGKPVNATVFGALFDTDEGPWPAALVDAPWREYYDPSSSWSSALLRGGTASTTTLAKEKLLDQVVTVDKKAEGIYEFCMLTSVRQLQNCRRNIERQKKLFITLNDDFRTVTAEAAKEMRRLLELVVEGLDPAPWELARITALVPPSTHPIES